AGDAEALSRRAARLLLAVGPRRVAAGVLPAAPAAPLPAAAVVLVDVAVGAGIAVVVVEAGAVGVGLPSARVGDRGVARGGDVAGPRRVARVPRDRAPARPLGRHARAVGGLPGR